jgi:hypothetical protein
MHDDSSTADAELLHGPDLPRRLARKVLELAGSRPAEDSLSFLEATAHDLARAVMAGDEPGAARKGAFIDAFVAHYLAASALVQVHQVQFHFPIEDALFFAEEAWAEIERLLPGYAGRQ